MTDGQARREAILWAQAEIARRPVYLDTETTGLKDFDEIVEICILDSDARVLLESLVKPHGRISVEAARLHGITHGMVKDALTWPEIWQPVEAALAGQQCHLPLPNTHRAKDDALLARAVLQYMAEAQR